MPEITKDRYDHWAQVLDTQSLEIIRQKRDVYTQSTGDVVRNFRLGAAMAGSTIGQNLAAQFTKQVIAMLQLITDPNCSDSEQDTRFVDVLNYTRLAYVLWKEGQAHDR
jgi:hypothetical protein